MSLAVSAFGCSGDDGSPGLGTSTSGGTSSGAATSGTTSFATGGTTAVATGATSGGSSTSGGGVGTSGGDTTGTAATTTASAGTTTTGSATDTSSTGGGGSTTTGTSSGGASGAVTTGGSGDAGATGGDTTGGSTTGATEDAGPPVSTSKFSFFVTSLEGMRRLSGSQDGFGGDLGGLEGADGICQQLASDVGEGGKTWRAFLSVTDGGDGQPVHAIDRIGQGPWYDRNERLIAENLEGLLSAARPAGDPQTVDDLPDEHGVPLSELGNSHDIITGSDQMGHLSSTDPANTCQDWTFAEGPGSGDRIMCGHSYPRGGSGGGGWPGGGGGFPGGGGGRGGAHWISDHQVRGCAAGVNLVNDGAGSGDCIGCGGGFGGIYCFAVTQ